MADPRKWQGLLQWSMKYSDGTAEPNYRPMSQEDKEWLEAALNQQVDPVERMKQIIAIQKGEDPRMVFRTRTEGDQLPSTQQEPYTETELLEYKELLLDELLDIVGQIDASKDFIKLGGLEALFVLFGSPFRTLREGAGEVYATVVQNNPFAQQAAVRAGAMSYLHTLLTDEDAACRNKALRCISCTVRGDAEAERIFLNDLQGLSIISSALAGGDVKFTRRALFLLRALLHSSEEVQRRIRGGPMLSQVLELTGSEDLELKEGSLQLLIDTLSASAEDLAHLQRTHPDAKERLTERWEELSEGAGADGSSSAAVERRLIGNLLQILAREPDLTSSLSAQPMETPSAEREPVLLLEGGASLSGVHSAP